MADVYEALLKRIPGISEPKVHLSFKSRLKWTGIILLLFLVMSQITIFGVAPQAFERFQFLELVLGSRMGTIMTLGIGPIVTASIILQLLVGSKIIGWDLTTTKGRSRFQGTQKLLTILFCFFEAFAFVQFGAIQSIERTPMILGLMIVQLAAGGIITLFMDEVVSKWGIGSGVSLFIAAGVSKTIFVRAFNPLTPAGSAVPAGNIPAFVAFLGQGELNQAVLQLLPVVSTIIVFMIVIYIQAIRVDIPLAFASLRGFGRRWPLKFIYTSNIPVILTAAMLANMLLVGSMLANRGVPLLGTFDQQGNPISGIMYYISTPQSVSIQVFSLILLAVIFAASFAAFYYKLKDFRKILIGSVVLGIILAVFATQAFVGLPAAIDWIRLGGHLAFYLIFSVIFAIFWVSTSGMDAKSVAEQIEGMGMQIPGFRRDPRIVEEVLNRYIPVLAVLGGLFVGLLAAVADITGALGTGTGILLTVMIIYNFYEIIASRYVEEMNPAMRKFFR
jgi:preprotein translocase subunit SecY